MTNYERELIAMIREHNDTEQALLTAVRIITEFLEKENAKWTQTKNL